MEKKCHKFITGATIIINEYVRSNDENLRLLRRHDISIFSSVEERKQATGFSLTKGAFYITQEAK